jgi:PAS domain S-box-containing protein
VTEHRRLTAEVETSRRQLALALAASGAVTWQWRPGTESLDWTPEYRALYGFTPDDPATYDRWLARIHPDDRVRLSARIQWMLETPGDDDWREEFRIHHPETGDRWLAGLGRVSRDPVGRATLVAGINFDVTDRKRAEQELVEARRFFHSIIDALSAHIAVLDENGVILAVNAAWRRFADENEFREDDYGVGSHYIREWKSSTDELVEGGLVSAGLRDVLLGRRNEFQLEYACHSLVQQRWFIMRATPFAAPHPMRVVVSHENITERKLAEEALQAADRHKGEFIAVLSHELRNPLAPIRNAVQILRRSGGTGEAAVSATDIIERQVGHLLRLVDDLLDINRISRGKFELKKERVELASVVRHAVEAARPLAASAGHELTVDLPPEPIYLDADPARIAQALGNLLTNAFKYTERGGRVWVAVKRDGGHAILRVRDTGVGLAVDQLTHIFEMFMQVDATLERSRGGLGIGLSLVKRLIEMHGGSVEAHSDGPGRGSEFTIRLPVVATPPRSVTCGSSNASAPSVARRRILVVDDNRDAADTLVMLLKLGGHEVHTAHDGLEAVEAAEKVRPHVILLDLGLPKLDGYEACRRIRQQLGSDLVLIALTGLGQEDHRLRSREAGFDAHMVKPVDYALLAKLLAEASAT